ncbi:MAG: ADP-ribosylglycohydrolase family protein [Desulfamplus sp.]|nr:ADP-ribosylglycohydrolase family protein [Desulfamplus sp.]
MIIGVISDIHGNYQNLLKAVNFLEHSGCMIFCLGDVASEDGEANNACIQLLYTKNIKTVIGQHDDTSLKIRPEELEESSLKYIKSMNIIEMFGNTLFVHDNPLKKARAGEGMWKKGSYINTLSEAQVVFDSFNFNDLEIKYIFFGHTHIPKIFKHGMDVLFEFGKPLKLTDGRYLINPGRIGGVSRSYLKLPPSFIVFDTDNTTITFYDLNNLPEPLTDSYNSEKKEVVYKPIHFKDSAGIQNHHQNQHVSNMLFGGILGDIVGSIYEGNPIKSKMFPLFGQKSDYTDDTVLTMAVAMSLITGVDYALSYKYFGRNYTVGFSSQFYKWAHSSSLEPLNSNGNGSAMRVMAVGYAMNSVEDVLMGAKRSSKVTHNHPEGIKGAQAVALSIFLARTGKSKDKIKREITNRFGYDLNRTLDDIRPYYYYKAVAEHSVPESIIAFLESKSVVDAVCNAVSLGGDSDTMACIAGAIAHAFYKHIPEDIIQEIKDRLPKEFLLISDIFDKKFCQHQKSYDSVEMQEIKEKIVNVLNNQQDKQPVKEFKIDWEEPVINPPLVRNDIEFDIEKYS